jgi:hypothetical protein
MEYRNEEAAGIRGTHDHGGEVTPKVRCGQLPSNELEISTWNVGLFWPTGSSFEGTLAIFNQTDDRF